MSRRRAWIWIAFGLACAVGAAALAFFTLQREREAARLEGQANAAPTAIPDPSISLPVASRRLEVGATIQDADVVLADYPIRLIPSNAISQAEQLQGAVLVDVVEAGEYFRLDSVAGMGGALSNSIPQGKEIFAFPIIDLLSTADVIQSGDFVDLVLTVAVDQTAFPTPQPGTNRVITTKMTGYTVQNVEIFRVVRPPRGEDEQATPPPTMLLMLLEPQQLLYIKYVKDFGGTIDLALRSPLDKEPFRAGPIIDQDLYDLMTEGTIKATPQPR